MTASVPPPRRWLLDFWTFKNRLIALVLISTLLPLAVYSSFLLHLFRQGSIEAVEMQVRQTAKSLVMLCEAQEALDRLKKSSPSPHVGVDTETSASPAWQEGHEYKSLKALIEGMRIGASGYAYVIDVTGHLLIHPHRQGDDLHESSAQEIGYLTEIRESAMALPLGVIGSRRYEYTDPTQPDAKPRTKIGAFGYFAPYDWIIVASCYEEELLSAYYGGRNAFFLLIASVTVVVALLVFFLAEGMMRPIVQLTEAASRVASGEYPSIKPLGTRDEIGNLTGKFTTMVHSLQEDRIQKLLKWNKELEKKVEERTAELKQAFSQMVTVEKMASLGKISTMVAHELNNPMSGILSYSVYLQKVLGECHQLPEEVRQDVSECLGMITNEAERCGAIVNNLLTFSRRAHEVFAECSLHETIERSAMVIEHSLRVKEIKLVRQLDAARNEMIWCDASAIEQMFINLIINALEATDRGGTITLQTDCAGREQVIARVGDTGKGMPPELVARIFDPFVTTKEDKNSVGLGLSVAYGVVQSHDGEISVESEVGKGTTFTIILPRLPVRRVKVEETLMHDFTAKIRG